MKHAIRAEGAPLPGGPYSQGIVAGPLVFVAGQVPRNPTTGLVPDGIEAQAHQVFRNIEAILSAAGACLADVVKVNAYLADMADFGAFNDVYRKYFGEPLPVRTTVGAGLIGIRVEVDVIAYREQTPQRG